MARVPRYHAGQFKNLTKDDFWDADDKRAQTEAEKKRLEELTIYRQRQEDIAEAKRKKQVEEQRKKQAERLRLYTCPFCESHDRDHRCEVFAQKLSEFSASRRERGIRSGVPYEWLVEYYRKQGRTPPSREDFENNNYQ